VLASNIGTVKTTSTAVNTSPSVFLSKASFIRGLWPSMKNALVDIYQSDGTTLRAGNVQVLGVPTQNKTQVRFGVSTVTNMATVNPSAVITAGDVIVPAGWRLNSCLGIEGIMKTTTGTLFNLDITNIAQCKTPTFDALNGPLSRKLIREFGAMVADNGSTEGGDLMVAASAYASLAEDFAALNRDTTKGGEKLQGESGLKFETPAGIINVRTWPLAKQGQGMYFAKTANAYRAGTTDNTMRPIKGLNEGFLTPLIDKSGCQSVMYSNQAPFIEQNWHNFFVQNIVSSGDIPDA